MGEVPEEKFCPDGLLFEASNPNNELCDYPFNVDCGAREYVRKLIRKHLFGTKLPFFCISEEPEPGLDPRCYRANGFFNHEDPNVCNKYVVHYYYSGYPATKDDIFILTRKWAI